MNNSLVIITDTAFSSIRIVPSVYLSLPPFSVATNAANEPLVGVTDYLAENKYQYSVWDNAASVDGIAVLDFFVGLP